MLSNFANTSCTQSDIETIVKTSSPVFALLMLFLHYWTPFKWKSFVNLNNSNFCWCLSGAEKKVAHTADSTVQYTSIYYYHHPCRCCHIVFRCYTNIRTLAANKVRENERMRIRERERQTSSQTKLNWAKQLSDNAAAAAVVVLFHLAVIFILARQRKEQLWGWVNETNSDHLTDLGNQLQQQQHWVADDSQTATANNGDEMIEQIWLSLHNYYCCPLLLSYHPILTLLTLLVV